MEPTFEVDLQDESTSPIPNPVFPPASQLRRAFFSDLDASSRVNPNRKRQETSHGYVDAGMDVMRTIVVGAVREDSPAVAESTSPDDDALVQPRRVERSAEFTGAIAAPRRSINPREDFGDEEADEDVSVPRTDGRGASAAHYTYAHDRVRAVSAVMANAVAGSLFGVLLRRTSSIAVTSLGAGVLVTQALCCLGYARVEWRALFSDAFSLIFHGVALPMTPEDAQNQLKQSWKRLFKTLSATVPRRLSFWLGCVGGLTLL